MTLNFTRDLQVADGNNDAFENYSGANFFSSLNGALYMNTHFATGFRHGIGLRFQNLTIPKGSTITSAYITIVVHLLNGGPINCSIGCQDVDNAVDFVTDADVNLRFRNEMTSAQTAWNTASLDDEGEYDSADFAASIQEVIDRNGWEKNNSLVVLTNPDTSPNDDLRIYAYAGSAAKAAKLHVEWSYPDIQTTDNLPNSVRGQYIDSPRAGIQIADKTGTPRGKL